MIKRISVIITILLLTSSCGHKQNEPVKGPRKLPAYNEKYIKLSELNMMKNKKKIVTYDEIVNFSEEEAMIDELIRKNERKLKEFMESEQQTKIKEPILEKEKDFAEEKNIIEIKDDKKPKIAKEEKIVKKEAKKGSSKAVIKKPKKDMKPLIIKNKEPKQAVEHKPVPVILKKEVDENAEEKGIELNKKKPLIIVKEEIEEPKKAIAPSKNSDHLTKEIRVIKKIEPRVKNREKGVSLGDILESGNVRQKRHSEPVTLIPTETKKRRSTDYLIQEERGRYSDERTQPSSDVDLERDAYRDY